MKKKYKEGHSANMKHGMGDYVGSAIRNKMGTVVHSYMDISKKTVNISKPPKSLA